ncbi:MAG: autotransporter-associated beta strand repeat-containing protein, partial [Thermoguttaceae bacterium]|nr:autotransporter-associated beta strand repeat-containing protein [Thermoguttaceae bacterium]
ATVSRGNAELKTQLTINKGGSATFGAFTISNNSGTPAALTMNGGTLTTGALTVNSGSSITVNDGSYTLSADSGADSVNNGTITLTGGSFEITSGKSFRVGGNNANAKLIINGGTFITPSSTPTYVATSTNGTIEQTNGTATFNGALILGWGNNSGTYNLSGGTLNTTGDAGLWNQNDSGVSTFNVTGGQANFNTFVIGLHEPNKADNALANVFNLNAGEVNTTGTFTVRKTGILNVSQTAQNAGGDGVLKANAIEINASGVLNLSSGTINLGSGGITSSDNAYAINLSGGTLGTNNASWSSALNATLSNTTTFSPGADQTITWSGVLTGNGGITKTGAGTLKLSGTNTFSGGITVSGGKLLVTGASVGTGKTTNNGATVEFFADSGETITITNQVGNYTANGVKGKTIKTGAGTLSTNNWISGLVELQQGTIQLTNGFGSGRRFNGEITIAKNAKLDCAAHDSLGYGDGSSTKMYLYGLMDNSQGNESLRNTEFHMYGGTAQSSSGGSFDILNSGVKFYSHALTGATPEDPTVSTVSSKLLLRHNDSLQINTDANSQLNLTGEITGWYNNKTQYNGSITKLGDGMLEITANNPKYSGTTTISAGTLKLSGAGTLGTGSVTNNATL